MGSADAFRQWAVGLMGSLWPRPRGPLDRLPPAILGSHGPHVDWASVEGRAHPVA